MSRKRKWLALACVAFAIIAVMIVLNGWWSYFVASLPFIIGMALWDISRTLVQGWWLKNSLNRECKCPKCGHEIK